MSVPFDVWEGQSVRIEVGESAKQTVTWYCVGTDYRSVAYNAIVKFSPVLLGWAFWRQSINLEQTGPDSWQAEITYGPAKMPDKSGQDSTDPKDGTWKLSWETMGGTQHVNQSKQTIASYFDPAVFPQGAPPQDQAINVSSNGNSTSVGGTDIHVPVFPWQEKRPMPRTADFLSFKVGS